MAEWLNGKNAGMANGMADGMADGMVEWRNGRMADGMMADWRNGGMAEWQPNDGVVEWRERRNGGGNGGRNGRMAE